MKPSLIFYTTAIATICLGLWLSEANAKPEAYTTPEIYLIAGSTTTSYPTKDIRNIRTIAIPDGIIRLSANINSPRCVSNTEYFIELNGLITEKTTFIMAGLLAQTHPCVVPGEPENTWPLNVYLNSGGGAVGPGFFMAKLMNLYRVITIVTGGQRCASMCTIAFLAAPQRTIEHNGQLMFHSPYKFNVPMDFTDITCDLPAIKTIFKAFYIDTLGEENGIKIYNKTMENCDPLGGWEVNRETALEYNLLTE